MGYNTWESLDASFWHFLSVGVGSVTCYESMHQNATWKRRYTYTYCSSLHSSCSHYFCLFLILLLFYFFASFTLLRTVRTSLLYVSMSSNNCVRVRAYKKSCCAARRFYGLASSVLNLSISLSRHSLQPLPFNATCLSSVEKTALRTPAIPSQSVGLLVRTEATSLAMESNVVLYLGPTELRHDRQLQSQRYDNYYSVQRW